MIGEIRTFRKTLYEQKIVDKTLHCYKMFKIDDKVLHLFN